jgi:nucleoside triphosphate diphosphatase
MKTPPSTQDSLADLLAVARDLRDPNGGCPWDLEQTHRSLARHLLEEASELVEVIESENNDNSDESLKEELGDVLFQVVIHAQLASEAGKFDFHDVARAVADKLIMRHPHVYGDAPAANTTAVLENWERIKLRERRKKQSKSSVLDGVPKALAALQRAGRLGDKAARIGFDWPEGKAGLKMLRSKVAEELDEFDAALDEGKDRATEELGDLFFALAQYARRLDIDAEGAARAACNKFEKRFRSFEPAAEKLREAKGTLSPEEWETFWQESKKN